MTKIDPYRRTITPILEPDLRSGTVDETPVSGGVLTYYRYGAQDYSSAFQMGDLTIFGSAIYEGDLTVDDLITAISWVSI